MLVCNYATRVTTEATPLVCEILHACEGWRGPDEIRTLVPETGSLLPEILDRLVRLTLLEASGRKRDPRERAMASLGPWNPEAGFFHTSTRDVPFASAQRVARVIKARAELVPMPSPVKRYRGRPTIALPPPGVHGEFAQVLTARRTWRRYSSTPLSAEDLATLLGLSAGVQQWVLAGARIPLKTSPSGGARHPIECYVVVRQVSGLRPAIYHYASDRHALERIRGRVSLERMQAYVPNSGYFARASAMVFFTAVFERILWRYPYSRAYRAALVEAGHVCQTFLLTATSLGLAPYCVMGLADSLIEKDLGIDGITESVLYCAGVGRPPRGTAWAPLPRGSLRVRANRHLVG